MPPTKAIMLPLPQDVRNIKLLLAPWPPTNGFSIGNHVSQTHETPIFMSNSVELGQVLGSVLNNSKIRTVTISDPIQRERQVCLASKTTLKLK